MGQASHGPYTWYEDDSPSSRTENSNPLSAGLPGSWSTYVWWSTGLVYTVFWMAESWKTSKPFIAATKFNHMAQGLWGLLVTLGCCYAVFQFWRRRSEATGYVLCILLAAAAMIGHRL